MKVFFNEKHKKDLPENKTCKYYMSNENADDFEDALKQFAATRENFKKLTSNFRKILDKKSISFRLEIRISVY